MESETLRHIRTMRQIKTSLDVAGHQKIKTTNSLYKQPEEIERLASAGLNDGQTALVLAGEKARAAKFEASAERSRGKLLKSREKMARLIARNRALTELRHQIQQERDGKHESNLLAGHLPVPPKSKYGRLRQIELKY
jgi:hypothetical protein